MWATACESVDCGEGQNTGVLPASDRNPAEDACCILISLQGKAGGGCVGGGNISGSSETENLSKNSGLARVSCNLVVYLFNFLRCLKSWLLFSMNEVKSSGFVPSFTCKWKYLRWWLPPCFHLVGWHTANLWTVYKSCSCNGIYPKLSVLLKRL